VFYDIKRGSGHLRNYDKAKLEKGMQNLWAARLNGTNNGYPNDPKMLNICEDKACHKLN